MRPGAMRPVLRFVGFPVVQRGIIDLTSTILFTPTGSILSRGYVLPFAAPPIHCAPAPPGDERDIRSFACGRSVTDARPSRSRKCELAARPSDPPCAAPIHPA